MPTSLACAADTATWMPSMMHTHNRYPTVAVEVWMNEWMKENMNEWRCTFIWVSYAGFLEKLVMKGIFKVEFYYKTEN